MTPLYPSHIDKEAIASLDRIATFEGEIILIDTLSQVSSAVKALAECGLVGFDTETRPSFTKGAQNEVALLQFSTLETAYLFRLNKIGFPEELQHLIEDESVLKVGLSLLDDFRAMRRREKVEPKGFIDLQKIVGAYGIQDLSLRSIYAILFGEKMSKQARLTNWEMASLPAKALHYAALDAYACVRIYLELLRLPMPPLEAFGKVAWASQ